MAAAISDVTSSVMTVVFSFGWMRKQVWTALRAPMDSSGSKATSFRARFSVSDFMLPFS
jgi:hypothetical protein